MRLIVTGGCGFIGSAVARAAIARNDAVLVIDRQRKQVSLPQLNSCIGKPGFSRLEADVTDRSLMRAVFGEFKPDAVVHLAAPPAEDPEALFDVHIAGAFSVLEACRRHLDSLDDDARERFRFVHGKAPATEGESLPAPREALAHSAASMIVKWSEALDLAQVACVAPDLFGPWQARAALMPSILRSALKGEPIVLDDAGETVRDWLSVSDLADGLLRAAEGGEPHGEYAFTACTERRDIDIAEALCTLLDARSPKAGGGSYAAQIKLQGVANPAVQPTLLDPTAAETDLGWTASGLHESLDRLVRWALTPAEPARTHA